MINFEKWLSSLSANESKTLLDIENYIYAKDFNKAIDELSKLDKSVFIRFTELSNAIDTFCKTNLDKIEPICKKHLESYKKHYLTVIYEPFTFYQMLKGYFFFSWASLIRSESKLAFSEEELTFTNKSASFHFFSALHSQLKLQQSKLIASNDFSKQNITISLNPAEEAAKFHSTPGLILLARAYEFLFDEVPIINVKDRTFAIESFTALLKARKLHWQSDSLKAIDHVYRGKGLGEEGFKSWDDVLKIYKAKYKLTPAEIEICYGKLHDKNSNLEETSCSIINSSPRLL